MPQPLFIRFLQPRGCTQRPVQGDGTFELALAEGEHVINPGMRCGNTLRSILCHSVLLPLWRPESHMAEKPFAFFTVVRQLGGALPDVKESSGRLGPSLKVRGKLLTCPAIHRSAEPNSLVVSIGIDERAELIAADPNVYYITLRILDQMT